MKVNTGSGLKPNSFRSVPEPVFGFAGMISTRQVAALDNTMAGGLRSSEETTMLKQPLVEKLAAMRLLGMADALKAQEQDPSARELSFLERFGLLVD